VRGRYREPGSVPRLTRGSSAVAPPRLAVLAAALGTAVALAACGTPAATGPTTTSRPGVADLTLTAGVRASLVAAVAAQHGLTPEDYVGLESGTAYYAFDPATRTYYAAAGVRPSPSSMAAQVGSQDDGAYNLFTRRRGASVWRVYDDGLGAAQDALCPLHLPAAVVAAWGWKPGSCYPPTAG
jgi:hypothetical protein